MLTTEYVYKDSAGAVLGTITRLDFDDGAARRFARLRASPNPDRCSTWISSSHVLMRRC